jgi:hypothetical protein
MDRARNREHLATLIGGGARRDERARSERRLDHQAALRETADQTIAPREVVCRRRRAGRKLRHHKPAARDLGGEGRVAPRIHHVDPRAEDRDGAPGAGEAAAMRRGVDAERKARDDGEAAV